MERLRFRRTLLALAAGAAGLATVATNGGTASAAVVSQGLDCGIGGSQTVTVAASAPATVEQGKTFKVTLDPAGAPGTAAGAEIKNMVTTFAIPSGSSVVAGSVKTSGGSGTLGAVSTSVSGNTLQLKVPGPIANGASFVNPSLEFELKATGAAGLPLKLTLRQNAGYTLTAAGSINVSCNAKTPLTAITTTTITPAPATTTTTTPGSSVPDPGAVDISYVNWSPTGGCGSVQTTTAPANTESVTITAAGGKGGRSGSQASSATVAGGDGGQAVATFAASGGQTFAAVVGCAGVNGGGFSNTAQPDGYSRGGGTGRGSIIAGQAGASGGSGGGSSAVCLGATCKPDASPNPLVVAGGGGGGGVSNCAGTPSGPGGAGGASASTADAIGSGNSGANGSGGGNSGGSGGGGGGGAGGVNSTGGDPNGGSSPNGSGGLGVNVVGGGGGGGWVGGNAGGNSSTGCKGAGGGGGGSSWVKNGATNASFGTAASASVTLTFKVATPITTTTTTTTTQPCTPDLVPFASAADGIDQNFEDFTGAAPTPAQKTQWLNAIGACDSSLDALSVSLLPTDLTTLDDARLVRLYLAYFKRPPDPSGFAFWQAQLDAGRGLINAARKFADSPEFKRVYGPLDNGEFIDLVYLNVLGREPDPTGREFWLTRLDNRTKNRGEVMINFSESSENVRRKSNEVQVFRLFRSMRQRFPSKAEFFALVDPINNLGKNLQDAAASIRTSTGYADRVS